MPDKKFTESILNLANQKTLTITGIEKVFAMNPNQIELLVCGQKLLVTGQNLEVERLDVENGMIKVKGQVDSLKYNHKKEKLFKRIFK